MRECLVLVLNDGDFTTISQARADGDGPVTLSPYYAVRFGFMGGVGVVMPMRHRIETGE